MKLMVMSIVTPLLFLLALFAAICINILQAICFLFVRQVSKNMFRRINAVLVEILFLFMMTCFRRIKVQLYTDTETYKLLGKEHAIVIPNHRHDVDTPLVVFVAQLFDCSGTTLTVSKDSIKYIPVIGWIGYFYEYFYLKRNWLEDKIKFESNLRALEDFPRPLWLLLFPEGTRFTLKKLLAAQEYATSHGLPIPKNVLIPRVKGFVSAVTNMRSFVPAVYDITIDVPKGQTPPSVVRVLMGQTSMINLHLKRIPIKDLPESEDDIAKWCRDRFVSKDELLDKLSTGGTLNNQECYTVRSKKPLIATISWVTLLILIYKLCQTFSLFSSWKALGISAASVASFAVFMYSYFYINKV